MVCGCDEAGAGPLAGPVYAAAVILPMGVDIPGLNDSKQLTEKRREALFPYPGQRASAWSVAWVDAEEIDGTDILSARMKAMQLAIDGLTLRRTSPSSTATGTTGQRRHHHAPPLHCKGGQPVSLYRRGLHPGQGEPGPVHGADGERVSPVRV
ncbi:MAG: hypothetical protein V8S34_04530 [Lawsonibacter sp.]